MEGNQKQQSASGNRPDQSMNQDTHPMLNGQTPSNRRPQPPSWINNGDYGATQYPIPPLAGAGLGGQFQFAAHSSLYPFPSQGIDAAHSTRPATSYPTSHLSPSQGPVARPAQGPSIYENPLAHRYSGRDPATATEYGPFIDPRALDPRRYPTQLHHGDSNYHLGTASGNGPFVDSGTTLFPYDNTSPHGATDSIMNPATGNINFLDSGHSSGSFFYSSSLPGQVVSAPLGNNTSSRHAHGQTPFGQSTHWQVPQFQSRHGQDPHGRHLLDQSPYGQVSHPQSSHSLSGNNPSPYYLSPDAQSSFSQNPLGLGLAAQSLYAQDRAAQSQYFGNAGALDAAVETPVKTPVAQNSVAQNPFSAGRASASMLQGAMALSSRHQKGKPPPMPDMSTPESRPLWTAKQKSKEDALLGEVKPEPKEDPQPPTGPHPISQGADHSDSPRVVGKYSLRARRVSSYLIQLEPDDDPESPAQGANSRQLPHSSTSPLHHPSQESEKTINPQSFASFQGPEKLPGPPREPETSTNFQEFGSFKMPALPNLEAWVSTPVGPRLTNPRAGRYKGIFSRLPGYGLQILNNTRGSAPAIGGSLPLAVAQDDNIAEEFPRATSITVAAPSPKNEQDSQGVDFSTAVSSVWVSETASGVGTPGSENPTLSSSPPHPASSPLLVSDGYSPASSTNKSEAASDIPALGFQPAYPSSSRALGVLDPYAATMFQTAFDEAIGIPTNRLIIRNDFHGPDGIVDGVSPANADHGVPTNKQIILIDFYGPDGIVDGFSPVNTDDEGDQVGASIDPFNTDADFRDALTNTIKQMMYVSGETGEPSVETTGIIEDIVRQQVVEILRSCTELAARRGSRSITINDLIFQIRDDAPKVSRLRTFLSWKDVRKNVKDSDDKGGDADIGAGEDPSGGVVPGGPVDDTAKKNKKARVGLPWEPASFYTVEVPEREDEEDEEEEEMNHITLQRLRKADERTKVMTREEYVTWSEFRQASFTYRKGKRFREWAGFGLVTDSKPSDDIVDILGFLTFEMVQTLTEEALKIKDNEDQFRERSGESTGAKKRKLTQSGLFSMPSEGRTPVEPRHIQEAFRRLQVKPKKFRAMLNGSRQQQHTNLKLI